MSKIELQEIPYGYCHCGCNQKTKISTINRPGRGWVIGEPLRFLPYHHNRLRTGNKAAHWNGGECKTYDGYIIVLSPDHPCSDSDGYIRRARLVMEKRLETIFPKAFVFHHNNHIRTDDRPENITIFKSQSEHAKFHQDENAFLACGNKHFRKCWVCQKYDAPGNMTKVGRGYRHRECYNKYLWEAEIRKSIWDALDDGKNAELI